MSRPYRAKLAPGVITDGENEIHLGSTGLGKLIPTLAPEAAGIKFVLLKRFDRQRMHFPFGKAASAVGAKMIATELVQDGFGKNAARRISCAYEENVIDAVVHE